MTTIQSLIPLASNLQTQAPAAPAQVPLQENAPAASMDSVAVTTGATVPAQTTIGTGTAAHAGTTADVGTAAPGGTAGQPAAKAALSLGALGRLLQTTGDGMARVGGLGGAAVGAGLGIAANLLIGTGGWMLPVAGAFLLGWECADAHSAKQALAKGVSSPEFVGRQQANKTLTPMAAASQVLTGVAAVGAIAAGIVGLGIPAGLVTGVVGGLGLSAALLISASRAEKAVVEAQK